MNRDQAKELAVKWSELHGLADAADQAGNFDDAESYRMEAADIELDLADQGFNVAALALT